MLLLLYYMYDRKGLWIEQHMAVEYHGQSKIDIHKEHMFNRQELTRVGIEYS